MKAFNEKDVERVRELSADDYEFVDFASGERYTGRDGSAEQAQTWFSAFPDLEIEIENHIDAGEWQVVEARARGTNTGPLATPAGELPATGRGVDIPFCTVVRVRGGEAFSVHDYYDAAAMMMQLGLMPDPSATTA